MASSAAPLWVLLVAQAVSTVGDAFGSRCSRVYYRGSRRRFFAAISAMNAAQLFVLLAIAQYALPRSIVGAIYVDGQAQPCFRELDEEHRWRTPCNASTCVEIDCPRQGPTNLALLVYYFPLVLISGAVNYCYYLSEIVLYHEALGVLFLVLASLGSSFLVPAVMWIFRMPDVSGVAWPVYVLGILGAVACTVENVGLPRFLTAPFAACFLRCKGHTDGKQSPPPAGEANVQEAEARPLLVDASIAAANPKEEESSTPCVRAKSVLGASVRLLVPFAVLSIAYAVWFCLQKVFNDRYRLNVFSFTSIDKVLFFLYAVPFLIFVAHVPPVRRLMDKPESQSQSFFKSLGQMWQETVHPWTSFFCLFTFRLLINARSFIYFYLAVLFDVNVVYLQLQLIRILFSWLGVVLLVLCFPRFIASTPAERMRAFAPGSVLLKLAGSALILVSLLMINHTI